MASHNSPGAQAGHTLKNNLVKDLVTDSSRSRIRNEPSQVQSIRANAMLRKLFEPLQSFHEDEDGIEAIQVVMIVAIAAIILIGFMTVGKEVFSWMKEKWNEMKGQSIE